jgi:glutathione synthase/RimK-type ligase-like ATP-grasp enzyme
MCNLFSHYNCSETCFFKQFTLKSETKLPITIITFKLFIYLFIKICKGSSMVIKLADKNRSCGAGKCREFKYCLHVANRVLNNCDNTHKNSEHKKTKHDSKLKLKKTTKR